MLIGVYDADIHKLISKVFGELTLWRDDNVVNTKIYGQYYVD